MEIFLENCNKWPNLKKFNGITEGNNLKETELNLKNISKYFWNN